MKACIKEYNASLPPLLKASGTREQLLEQIETVDPELAKKNVLNLCLTTSVAQRAINRNRPENSPGTGNTGGLAKTPARRKRRENVYQSGYV